MSIAIGNQIKELAAMVLDLQARVAALEAGPHAEIQKELRALVAHNTDPPREKRSYVRKAPPPQ